MAIFSSNQPSLRARILPRFPAQVVAGNGITITKSGGVYTFAVAPADLTTAIEESTVPLSGELAASNVIQTVTSVTLIAGGWEVSGATHYSGVADATTLESTTVSISTVAEVLQFGPGRFSRTNHDPTMNYTGSIHSQVTPVSLLTVDNDTVVFLMSIAVYTSGTWNLGGILHARRF